MVDRGVAAANPPDKETRVSIYKSCKSWLIGEEERLEIECSCGCPNRSPVSIRFDFIAECVTENYDLVEASNMLPNKLGNLSALKFAAIHALKEGRIERLPDGWPAS